MDAFPAVKLAASNAAEPSKPSRSRSPKCSARMPAAFAGGIATRSALRAKHIMHLSALIVVKPSRPTAMPTVSIAAGHVMSPVAMGRRVGRMNDAYRAKLEPYLSTMLLARWMQALGIISQEDFLKIDEAMAQKYGVPLTSLYRGIDLQSCGIRGNMSHHKEVSECQGQ